MAKGEVIHIAIKQSKESLRTPLKEVQILVNQGLEGDWPASESRQVTIIEEEAILELRKHLGIEFAIADSRRNVVVRGIELNLLVGAEFWLGEAKLKGTALCHPCNDLERNTSAGVKDALKGRGGLCATVLESGKLKLGSSLRLS